MQLQSWMTSTLPDTSLLDCCSLSTAFYNRNAVCERGVAADGYEQVSAVRAATEWTRAHCLMTRTTCTAVAGQSSLLPSGCLQSPSWRGAPF
eukprot:m.104786 g.104786  ORF g.104786 m.104786 type:complete len:92 (+) comp51614_c2_seq5:80-355(+)